MLFSKERDANKPATTPNEAQLRNLYANIGKLALERIFSRRTQQDGATERQA